MNYINSLTIRLETPDDYHAVEGITREAFWAFWEPDRKICDEHLLVHKLRKSSCFVPKLDFIAELDGKIVGHIIYTTSKIVDDAGNTFETLTFGPLSVLPEFQNRGIGKSLIRHTLTEAKGIGYRAVLIFGHPDYYTRVGFRRAADFGITTADGKTFDPFMAYPLYDDALNGISGRYYIDPVYDGLTQEDALEFDKRFPPKEPFVTTSMDVLLRQLDPDARASLEKTGCKSLQMMTSKSEQEISSLPGISGKTIEIIRAVLRDHGIKWGAYK